MTQAMHQILVIEDEPGIRAVLRVLLEAEHYRVIEAGDGERGEIEARTHKPDLLLVDLGLPDGDGVAVIRRVRTWSPVPIVVLSARTMESQKVAALDAGADDYVTKPFSAAELLARVRAGLRRSSRGAGALPALSLGGTQDRPDPSCRDGTGRHDPRDAARVPRPRVPRTSGRDDHHVATVAARGLGSGPCRGLRRAARVHQGPARQARARPAAPAVPGDGGRPGLSTEDKRSGRGLTRERPLVQQSQRRR